MKKFITFTSVLGLVLFFTAFNGNAQGKGQGQGHAPVVTGSSQGHDVSSDHGSSKVKSDDHGEHTPKTNSDFATRISNNPELNARILKLLPMGMDLKTAAMGFKNQGQFIAALHVSKNLNIPFDQLKAKMTGSDPESLGKAIHELRPTLPEKQVEVEADKAEEQAKVTVKDTTTKKDATKKIS